MERAFAGDRARALIYNRSLARLRDIAREVAKEQGAIFVNLHDPMIEFIAKAKAKYGKDYWLCGDGGHPDRSGHLLMAYLFLKGASAATATSAPSASTWPATRPRPDGGHKVVAYSQGRVEIESSRYPFCFSGDAARLRRPRRAADHPVQRGLKPLPAGGSRTGEPRSQGHMGLRVA